MRRADHTGTTAALFNQTGIYFVLLDLEKVMRELDEADKDPKLAASRYADAEQTVSAIQELLPRLKPTPNEIRELRKMLSDLEARVAGRRLRESQRPFSAG